MNDERFDELWSGLKDQITEARTARKYDQAAVNDGPPSRYVAIRNGDEDGSSICLQGPGSVLSVDVRQAELLTIAAHCLVAAEEIEADKIQRQTA